MYFYSAFQTFSVISIGRQCVILKLKLHCVAYLLLVSVMDRAVLSITLLVEAKLIAKLFLKTGSYYDDCAHVRLNGVVIHMALAEIFQRNAGLTGCVHTGTTVKLGRIRK